MPRPSVFISYSHRDENWKDLLVRHLSALERQGLLDIWDDRRIYAGDDWYQEIKSAISAASITILIVSPDFLSSQFIQSEEVPLLLMRHAKDGLRIFPIIVKPCIWQQVAWLSRLNARPKDGRPLSTGDENQIETDLAEIAREVHYLLKHAGIRPEPKSFVPLPPDKISLARLPSTNSELYGRERELALLDACWENPRVNVVSLIALGGVGKTAIINVWLNKLEQNHYQGAERVFAYSFYNQGDRERQQDSADPFITTALTWFGDPNPDEGSPWNKGERLSELIKKQRTLLILDGLEPLQFPPGEFGGRLKDLSLLSLLRELSRHNSGLCIITTRLPPDDLKEFIRNSVEEIELENLSHEAGMHLLLSLRVKGNTHDLEQASREFDGHALALTLLGRFLSIVYEGDIQKRDRVAKLTGERKLGGHANRVMDSYEKWFVGKPELNILYLLGLFNRPADVQVLKILIATPAIEGLTSDLQGISNEDWRYALHNLREARLLTPEDLRNPHTLDCHPLVRQHFGEKLKEKYPAAWKEANSQLFDFYKSQAEEFPNSIEEMLTLYWAVTHGCQGERHQEVLDDIYKRRIRRGEELFNVYKLNAFSTDLAALSNFLDQSWCKPSSALNVDDQGFVMSAVGFDLRVLGRLAEAIPITQTSMELSVTQKDWAGAAIDSRNLSQLQLLRGNIDKSIHYAQEAVRWADLSGSMLERMVERVTLGDALHSAGRLADAEIIFLEAEDIQKARKTEYSQLYSLGNFRYCDLLLNKGRYQEVYIRGAHVLRWAEKDHDLLDIALSHLSLGYAYLLQFYIEGSNVINEANAHLEQSINFTRQAGRQDFLPRCLLARAELFRVITDFSRAQQNVEEAKFIAVRAGMALYEADSYLEYARLYLAVKDSSQARKCLAFAEQIIERTGYFRQKVNLILCNAWLYIMQNDYRKMTEHLDEASKIIIDQGCHRWEIEKSRLKQNLG